MRRNQVGRAKRGGFTTLELIISVFILTFIFTITITMFRTNTRAVSLNAARLDAQQNSRFAVNAIDRDLRLAGIGVANMQPVVVQASPTSITFNSDLVTRTASDAGAVYYDKDADTLAVTVLPKERAITLPVGGNVYPDSTYSVAPGYLSHAETISFFIRPDSSTARTDDYVMFKRVNDLPPQAVAKSIIIPGGTPIFRYFKSDSVGNVLEIAQSLLPLMHSAPFHGAANDTAGSALTDSIRSVRVHIESIYHDVNKDVDVTRIAERGIRLANAGLNHYSQCGSPPATTPLLAAAGASAGQVHLTWSPSSDETGGEHDVTQYQLFRRRLPAADWGEVIVSVPSGDALYAYDDTSLPSGVQYQYAVAAVDCTPAPSTLSASNIVTTP